MKNILIWNITKFTAFILAIISFTPLILSPNTHTPYIFGMPFSLGAGILISIIFIVLVVIGALFAPNANEKEET